MIEDYMSSVIIVVVLGKKGFLTNTGLWVRVRLGSNYSHGRP